MENGYLNPGYHRGHGTLSWSGYFIGTLYVAIAQVCHAIVVRDKVLGHEVEVERQRGPIVGCLDPHAKIEVLQQPRLLQRRSQRERVHEDPRQRQTRSRRFYFRP